MGYYPNGEKIESEEYDYAQAKATDVSFSNPEMFDAQITQDPELDCNCIDVKSRSFHGPICNLPKSPDIIKRDQQPTPPPRPEITLKHLKVCKNTRYECNELKTEKKQLANSRE